MNYHKIERTSIANGEGVRVVLWVGGCSLHCKGCHNPQTWRFDSGKLFDEDAKQELFKALSKPWIQGITFSGGHPLEPNNVQDVYILLSEIKEKFPAKDIWLYTGYELSILNFTCEYENCLHHNYMQRILSACDIVVDGPFIEDQKDLTLKWIGSKNQRVIDVKQTLNKNNIVLYQDK